MPFVLLGDQGYPLKEYLMRPYPSKWRCLKTGIQIDPNHVDTIVKSICLIHNIIINQEGVVVVDETLISQMNENLTNPDQDTNQHTARCNNRSKQEAYIIRDKFKEYFNNIGAVSFQDNRK